VIVTHELVGLARTLCSMRVDILQMVAMFVCEHTCCGSGTHTLQYASGHVCVELVYAMQGCVRGRVQEPYIYIWASRAYSKKYRVQFPCA